MSSDPDKKFTQTDQEVNRRNLLGKAAVVVGAAAASIVAGKSAVARPDVAIDSEGRVIVKGAVVIQPVEPQSEKSAEPRTEIAKANTPAKPRDPPSRSRKNDWCINHSRRQHSRKRGETLLAGR